jgi:ComF family protein
MLARVGAMVRTTGEGLFSTLFPAECRLCNQPLLAMSRLPVCDPCLAKIQAFQSPVCTRCGEILTIGNVSVCTACTNAPPPFVAAVAIGPYDGELRGLVHLLKYHSVRPAAQILGRALTTLLQQQNGRIGDQPLILPIPLHRAKDRARGFNQAEEIANVVKRFSGFAIDRHALVRKRATESQTGMTSHQRRENVRGAFALRKRGLNAVNGRNIVLIDDVMTTGATAAECTRVLLRAGAKQVLVATAARVTRATQSMPQMANHPMAAGA